MGMVATSRRREVSVADPGEQGWDTVVRINDPGANALWRECRQDASGCSVSVALNTHAAIVRTDKIVAPRCRGALFASRRAEHSSVGTQTRGVIVCRAWVTRSAT